MNSNRFLSAFFGKPEAGVSLAAVLVGVGIAGMTTVVITKNFSNNSRMNAKIFLDQDKIQIKTSILSTLDCKATFGDTSNPIDTDTVGDISLRNAKGGTFIPANGRKIGNWYVVASIEENPSNPGSNMLQVKVARPKNMNNPKAGSGEAYYYVDPLNKSKVHDWNASSADLIHPDAPLCDHYFVDNPSATCPSDKKLVGIDHNGLPVCVDHNIQDCPAGQKGVGISASGELVCADNSVSQDCGPGQKANGLNTDGSLICEDLVAGSSCPEGQKQTGVNANGTAKCSTNTELQECPAGQKVVGTNPSGELICGNNATAKACAEGYTVSGIMTTGEVICSPKLDNNESCEVGEYVSGVEWDGTPTCTSLPPTGVNKQCPSDYAMKGLDANGNPICQKIINPDTQIDIFGGVFQRRCNQSYCRSPNNKFSTAGCNCVSGYDEYEVSEYCGNWEQGGQYYGGAYCDLNSGGPYATMEQVNANCGYVGFICIRRK